MRLIRRKKSQRGQSLVEFALTSLMVVFLLIAIIELARVLHAYLTIQYATRQAARYAVTGQRMAKYVNDPTAGWVEGSSNIMKTIPPCWPRFPDDPASPTKNGPAFFEPYRNARTCSIEEQALQAMRPLAVRTQAGRYNDPNCKITDPNQRDTCPGFYEVTVSSRVDDWTPTTGTFTRGGFGGFPSQTLNYSTYYSAIDPDGGADLGAVNGFGGRPLDKVVIRIRYNHPIMAPFLSAIVPYIQLQAREEVVNESFGSTSLQRDPVLPPELPPIPELTGVEAPDLAITRFTVNGSGNIDMGDPVTFDLAIANQGLLTTNSGYTVKVFVSPTQLPAEAPLPSGLEELGSGTLPVLVAGAQESLTITGRFTTTGRQYVYAWVDANEQINEDPGGNPNRETQNVTELLSEIDVQGGSVNLSLSKAANPTSPRIGDTVSYFLTINNPSSFTVSGIEVTDTLPAEMVFVSASPGCGSLGQQVRCIIDAAPSSSSMIVITARVTSGNTGSLINNSAQISQIPASFVDPDTSNNSASAAVVIDGVDLRLLKSVVDLNGNNAEPGDIIEYTIEVSNSSTATPATDVTVTDTLPSEITLISADARCTGTTTITCSIGTLNSGESTSLVIQAQINAGASGSIVNAANVTSSQPEAYTSNNRDIAPLAVASGPIADTAVSITADINGQPYNSGDLVKEGDIVRFNVTLTNNGPFDATNLAIDQVVSPNNKLFFLSSAADSGTYDTGTGQWTVPSLAHSASTTLTLRYRIMSGAAGQSMSLTSTISASDQNNPNTSGNNSATRAIPVSAAANLVMSQTVSSGSVEIGQTMTFTISVGNGGPSTATNIVVLTQDLVDAANAGYFTIMSASPNFGIVDGTYRWTIASLPYGATARMDIVVKVNALPVPNPFINEAQIHSLTELDTDTSNNSASVTVTVTTP